MYGKFGPYPRCACTKLGERMIAWLVVFAVWSAVIGILGIVFEKSSIVAFAATMLTVVILVAAVYGSIEFLRFYQAWPFTPK